jgi:hypothetical protein
VRLRCNSKGCSELGGIEGVAGAVCALNPGMVLTRDRKAGWDVRAPGLGICVTGRSDDGSDWGRGASFAGVGGSAFTVRSTGLDRETGGGTDGLRSV